MTKPYYQLPPEQIFKDIVQSDQPKKNRIKGSEFLVYPHVYPSEKFRTTNFLLDISKPLFRNARVCDMGCGMGIVGLFALQQGAKTVVQVDINPIAVENARANIALHHFSDQQIKVFESNCFDNVPEQTFDVVIFNIPFHSEFFEIRDPLEYAFHDPNFTSTRKFLHQAANYCNFDTSILIAFSSKGDIVKLEEIFASSGYKWELWKIINTQQKCDNRIYRLHMLKCPATNHLNSTLP